jgi:hypothetical protein
MAIKGSKLPGDASHFARGGKIAKDSSGAIQKARLIHMQRWNGGTGRGSESGQEQPLD